MCLSSVDKTNQDRPSCVAALTLCSRMLCFRCLCEAIALPWNALYKLQNLQSTMLLGLCPICSPWRTLIWPGAAMIHCDTHPWPRWHQWIASASAEKVQPRSPDAMLARQLWVPTTAMFIVYIHDALVDFSKRWTGCNGDLSREANDNAYRVNNTSVVWRVTAVSYLSPTIPLTCHVGASSSYRSLYNEQMLWQFPTHADTRTHEHTSKIVNTHTLRCE